MISFRAQFAPIISDVITINHDSSLADLKKMLRIKWNKEVKTTANEYMASEWSREASLQLATHPDRQKTITELPLFKEMT